MSRLLNLLKYIGFLILAFLPFFFFLSISKASAPKFLDLFKNKKPVIAALMIDKDLSSEVKIQRAIGLGLEQIKIAKKNEVDGILFEFRAGEILEPAITEEKFKAMLKVARALVKASSGLIIGFEILWHFPEETLRLAQESRAQFVRIDFFSDEVMAGKKKVPIDPEKIQSYRQKINAENVFLLTDIQVKYSKMIDPKITLAQSAQKASEKGSDGLIVTATKSGEAPSVLRFKEARSGARNKPLIVGSGFSVLNAKELLPHLDAIIVGTSISKKTGGPLIDEKVAKLMNLIKAHRKTL